MTQPHSAKPPPFMASLARLATLIAPSWNCVLGYSHAGLGMQTIHGTGIVPFALKSREDNYCYKCMILY